MLYRLFVADHRDAGHRRPSLEAVLSSDMKPAATGGGMEAGPGLSQWSQDGDAVPGGCLGRRGEAGWRGRRWGQGVGHPPVDRRHHQRSFGDSSSR